MVWVLEDKWYDDDDYTITDICETLEVAQRVAADQVRYPGEDAPVLKWDLLSSAFDNDEVFISSYVDDGHDLKFIIREWVVTQ